MSLGVQFGVVSPPGPEPMLGGGGWFGMVRTNPRGAGSELVRNWFGVPHPRSRSRCGGLRREVRRGPGHHGAGPRQRRAALRGVTVPRRGLADRPHRRGARHAAGLRLGRLVS